MCLLMPAKLAFAQADHTDSADVRQEYPDHPLSATEESRRRVYWYGRKPEMNDEGTCGYDLRKEMVAFVTWKISSDKQSGKNPVKRVSLSSIQWDSTDYSLIGALDTLFAMSDIQYVKSQLECYAQQGLSWRRKEFKNVQVIKPGYWLKMQKDEAYWSYSLPIFLPDQAYSIVKYSYECEDGHCATHITSLFKRTKDGWEEVLELQRT